MCGIIAIQGKKTPELKDETIAKMLSCLSRRGPDDQGFNRHSETVIGQTRLSIVDLVRGHQPMPDNTLPISIVFNGEIYGYQELRSDLEKKGHRFTTNSDTETILKAYAEYGKECVKYLDGMFAFAIYDERTKELFIARDRFGKKPFYYADVDGTFIAASEMKSIFSTSLIKGKIDPCALDDYLRLMYIPPYRTIYSNIHTLLPAHAGIVKDGKVSTWRYWDLEKKKIDVTYEEAKETIKRLFDEAVRKRMIADVEIGTLLSGRFDSTLVTLYSQNHSKKPIKTFSVGYEDGKSELPFALEAAQKIGTDHHSLAVTANLAHELEEIIEYADEPIGDNSAFPQHLISKLASSKVKVALTGDGADELFMGYGSYQKHWHTPRWKISRWFSDPWRTQQREITIFSKQERKILLKDSVLCDREFEKTAVSDLKDPIHKINAFDLKMYLPGQLLTKIDRTSMMHSLEARSPFLDTKLAEYVYNLPTKFKVTRTKSKVILKDILAETFPESFVYRRKQGFGAPVESWLLDPRMRAMTNDLLDNDSNMYDYIDKREVLIVKEKFYAGDKKNAHKLWILLTLALWFRTHQR